METALLIIELVGIAAFAVSGAMVAMRKGMDIFGVVILGFTTALGGGVLRDLILGNNPPEIFKDEAFAITAILTSAFVFLPFMQKFLFKTNRVFEIILLVFDTIGLGIFVSLGIHIARLTVESPKPLLLITAGLVTAVGGGVIRDMMADTVPFVFSKHFYASAAIIGAAVCTLMLALGLPDMLCYIVCSLIVIVLRFLAARFRWRLPRAKPTIGG